jgi:hypothetical protein
MNSQRLIRLFWRLGEIYRFNAVRRVSSRRIDWRWRIAPRQGWPIQAVTMGAQAAYASAIVAESE